MFDAILAQFSGSMLYAVLVVALVICGVGNPAPECCDMISDI